MENKIKLVMGVSSVDKSTLNHNGKTDAHTISTVCVLGMHRSGTSCLSGALQTAGISGGNVIEYANDNPKGNRENQSIMKLNDRVLAHNDGTWDNPPITLNYSTEHQQQRDQLIRKLNSQFPVWMFKDPRTVLTLPFWQNGISNLQLIGTFRHPLKVAMSLYQRQGISIPLRKGIKLWIHYNSLILEEYHKVPFPLICFDLPQTEYLTKLTEIMNNLKTKIPNNCKLSVSKVAKFYESTLVNQENTAILSPTQEDAKLLAQAESLYQDLREKAGLEVNLENTKDKVLFVPLEEESVAYLKAIEAQPNNSQLHFMLAKTQQNEGNLEKAIASSRKALELDPNSVDIVEQLSKLLVEVEQDTEAISLVESLVESQPDNPRTYLILAGLQRQQKDFEGAILSYQKIIELIPQSIPPHFHLGNLLIQDNRLEEAIVSCQKALELHPENSDIYFVLGKAYAKQEDLDKAITYYQKAIEFDFHSPSMIYVHLANAFKQQGNKQEALATYQYAIDSQPDSIHGYIGLGNYYRQQKDLEKAIANFQKAIELNCHNPGVYFALGQSLRE